MKLFKDIFTGKDNQTADGIKILALIGVIIFLFGTIYEIFVNHKFDGQSFCNSLSTIIGAVCVALRIKQTTEPE